MSSTQQSQYQMDGEMRVHRPLDTEERVNEQVAVEQMHVNGREYLVFPLIAAREMVLDYPENGTRELLPARHLQESVPLWEGTPICFVHPENKRKTADDPREYTQTIIGQAYQPQLKDGEKLRVMAYIDVDKARDFGGLAETVVDKLLNSEQLGVSAGYATLNDDHSGGNFNGQEYDVEQGYIIPDHIAIFPNDEFKARCDWEDGCGAPRVNYEVPCDRQNQPDPDNLNPAEGELEHPRLNIREDEYVQWDWSGGTAYGQVEEIVDDGTRSVSGNERSVDADDPDQIVVIQQYDEEGNRQGQRVIKYIRPDGSNEDNLRSWDAPPQARENIPSEPEQYTLTRSGEYVLWDTGDSRQHGQVTAVADDGCLEVNGTERCVSAGDGTRVVQIQHYSQDGDVLDGQSLKLVRREAPNEGNLRSWNAPRSARTANTEEQDDDMTENTEDDPATLFTKFLRSIGVKANAEAIDGEGAEELMGEVEDTVDTDEEATDTATDETDESQSEDESETAEPDEPDDDGQEQTDTDDATTSEGDPEDSESEESESETEGESDDDAGEVKQNTVEDVGDASDDADSEQDTVTDDGDTSDDSTQMKENQAEDLELEDIAAKTAFGVSELEGMDDTMLAALERTVQEMSDDISAEAPEQTAEAEAAGSEETGGMQGGEGVPGERANTEEVDVDSSDDGTESNEQTENTMDENESNTTDDGGQEEQTVNTDQFLTTEEAEEQFATKDDVDEINENVEQIKGMVQNLESEQEDAQKEEQAQIVANAIEGMSVEAAKALPEDELDDLAETHATRTNYAAVPGQRAQVTTNTQSEEDIDDYPAGGRSNWQERKAEGGD